MCVGTTTVNLRVEGKTTTIFEGAVTTCGHRVTTKSGGTRHCNGTNNDKNPCAGPTCTTALDDANKIALFGFDGTYDEGYDDFFIKTIGDETPEGNDSWQIALNLRPTPIGGCQQKVTGGDEVSFAVVTYNVTKQYLRLSGPVVAEPNVPVVFTVKNEENKPIQGATVRGQSTNANGEVSITFPEEGTFQFKATKSADSVRSKQHTIRIRSLFGPAEAA